jgi:hypothetical protein
MNRREILIRFTQLALAVGTGAVFSDPAGAQMTPGQNMRMEITKLWLVIQIDLALKNYGSARERALQLVPMSQVDPNWFTYADSFNISRTLFKLTPPAERQAYIFAARGVLESFPGMSDGETSDNLRTVAAAAYVLVEGDAASSVGLPREQLATAAALLLVMSGAAPGSERSIWAKSARRGLQRYGGSALADWSTDKITPRFAASGIAMSGDWKAAAAEYERFLPESIGNMDRLLKPRSSKVGGLAGVIAGANAMQYEAATAIAMSGRPDRAIEVMELARQTTLTARRGVGAAASGFSPRQIEAQLVTGNTAVVQVATSILGAFALVSIRRGKAVQHFQAFNSEHGGVEIMGRLLNTGALHFTKDGLLPAYIKARKDKGKDGQAKLLAYCGRATNDTEDLIGSTIRNALRQAKVGPGADVLVILSASLAVLPIALAAAPGGQPLGREYQLRFADSLASAARAAARAKGAASKPPTVDILGSAYGTSGLPFVGFERDCVIASFGTDRAAASVPVEKAEVISWPQRGGYWHVASHASWDFGKPERSGIVMGKKRTATVDDILRLAPADPPRLVFLSACETALINIKQDLDQFVGLSTAFLAAGAGGVIASQWPVSDAASALLAVRFYQEHIAARQPPAMALARAQRWLASATASELTNYVTARVTSGAASREDGAPLVAFLGAIEPATRPFEHPYFWGGFQLYGA